MEQWTHKPLDVGSNPTLATHFKNDIDRYLVDVFVINWFVFGENEGIVLFLDPDLGGCKLMNRKMYIHPYRIVFTQ